MLYDKWEAPTVGILCHIESTCRTQIGSCIEAITAKSFLMQVGRHCAQTCAHKHASKCPASVCTDPLSSSLMLGCYSLHAELAQLPHGDVRTSCQPALRFSILLPYFLTTPDTPDQSATLTAALTPPAQLRILPAQPDSSSNRPQTWHPQLTRVLLIRSSTLQV